MAGSERLAPARRTASAVDALEQEHRRLARDIHDGPAQTLTNVALHSEIIERLIGVDNARAIAEVRELRQEALAAADEIRQMIYQLVPPGLMQRDLAEVIAEHSRRLQARYRMTIHTDISPVLPASKEAQATIFRVIQEALHNSLRHSGSREAWVRVRQGPAPSPPGAGGKFGQLGSGAPPGMEIIAEVWDSGRGFDPQDPALRDTRHLGIAGMRERAALAGGTLIIASQPGAGARVTLQLPGEDSARPPSA